ncbi:MAG: acid phosphatase, partial [Candidatus Eremiobacteraeota bacterium]|nr:acid phosphatase [Candidatus Eremiobacteraeota bacterium]
KHLPPIIAWDAKNNGLLIVTWDEASPDNGTNPIATILVGPMVKPNVRSSQRIDHYAVTRTIEDVFALKCTAQACNRQDVAGIWR